jgi:enoyl-CoA hydratase
MIGVVRDGDLWTITLNRPDKANALTLDMLGELADLAEQAAGLAKVFVLTGTGRVFSAGADLDQARAGLATNPAWERLSGAIAALPCLTIAALNGTLAGGAFGMALACDLRIAAQGAKFFYPVMQLGFLPQPSDPERLCALVGPARAKLILMGAVRLTSDQALAFGLIDRVVAPDDLADCTAQLAAAALGASHDHIRAIKAMVG